MSKPIGLKVNTPELMKQRSFVQTVRTGGITSAAKLLGLTPSAVSKNIARLEAELGTQLLARDNRHLTPTERGQEAYAAYADLLAQLDRVHEQLTAPTELGGQLSLSIPSGTLPWLTPLLDAFRAACPQVQLHLNISDDYSDLVRDRNDFALRLGSLKDSNLRALALPATPLIICAAPAYLTRAGTPQQPAQLASHEGMLFRRPGSGRIRPLELPAGAVGWQPRAVLDDGQALAHAALAGFGLAQLPMMLVAAEIADGRLVEVLQPYRPAPLELNLLYAASRWLPRTADAFLDVARRHFWPERAGQPHQA